MVYSLKVLWLLGNVLWDSPDLGTGWLLWGWYGQESFSVSIDPGD